MTTRDKLFIRIVGIIRKLMNSYSLSYIFALTQKVTKSLYVEKDCHIEYFVHPSTPLRM